MLPSKLFTTLFTAGLMASSVAAMAGLLTDSKGMTLYIYDKDVDGKSTCYDKCVAVWPPYLGNVSDPMTEGWTLVDRTDGTKQWAYDGKPTYYFTGDKKVGDKACDGSQGVWHVVNE